jgi:hypothetical protein
MAGWESSPGHRADLLNPQVTETGVGVAVAPGPPPRYYAVQDFGLPNSARISLSVQNKSDATVGYEFGGARRQVKPHSSVSQTTCTAGSLTFDQGVGATPRSFAVKSSTTYVISSTSNGVQITVQ